VDDLRGDLDDVAPVLLGQDDRRNLRGAGREDLLLDAADGQHLAAQRDLAGHRHVAADLASRERRDHRGRDRDAGRGPVLRDRALRHVDVDVVRLEEVLRDLQIGRVARARTTSPPARTPS
jgi:hypothetical protein